VSQRKHALPSRLEIENVISALPAILAQHPNVVYIVLGATHPSVVKHEEGELSVIATISRTVKGVEGNVIFYNRFVSLEELIQFIGVADIYITPYLYETQITSGTMAYTLGAGKAVVSTPPFCACGLFGQTAGPASESTPRTQTVSLRYHVGRYRHAAALHFFRTKLYGNRALSQLYGLSAPLDERERFR